MISVEQIKAARAMLNLSQKQLADKAGISVATLNNIERGAQTDPKISTLKAIEHALELKGIEFMHEHSGGVGVRLRPQKPGAEQATILIIDDNAADRALYKNWLGKAPGRKYTIVEAENARAGYEAFVAHKPDCIVLDFMMYGMDGFQLLVEMKRDHPAAPPIVFVTGVRDQALETSARKVGVHAYLDKNSMTRDDLQAAVKSALNRQK